MRRNNLNSLRKFERLEDRRMMTADINLIEVDGVDVLAIQGTNNDDSITIMATTIIDDGDEEEGVLVTIRERSYDGFDDGLVLLEEIFERDDIEELEVYALDGNDWIQNWTDIPGTLDGGNHGDNIMGGFANDTIYGRSGSDTIIGGLGDNDLFGGPGNDDYVYMFNSYMYPVDGSASDVLYEDPSLDTDEINCEYLDGGINLDLASTSWQVVNPQCLSLRLSSATGIEDVYGSRFDDTIRGNSRDNNLKGNEGNDELYGREGADTLSGFTGDDDLYGEGGSDTYRFVTVGYAVDEFPLGFDEILNEAANVDSDTLDFSSFDEGVNVNLAVAGPQYAVNSPILQLTLSNATAIENVIGTRYADSIIGNSRPNDLEGRGLNDWIVGGEGNDTLDGGAGNDTYAFGGNTNLGTDKIEEAANIDTDTLYFGFMSHGLTVDLTKFGKGNYAVNSATLKLELANDTAIEDVYGTGYTDTIIGNSRNNKLHGRNGNDTIRGNAGIDYLYGGAHNDRFYSDAFDQVFGESGTDIFDGVTENSYAWMNPRPYNYQDWSEL